MTDTKDLTIKQLRYLRSLAHNLKPILWIGQKGLSDTLFENITEALRVHELIKIKFHEKEELAAQLSEITSRTQSVHVQTIGKIIVLYKENRKKEPSKRITIPADSKV